MQDTLPFDLDAAVSIGTTLVAIAAGADKQEKVNLIVVLSKLLDMVPARNARLPAFDEILTEQFFDSLLTVVSVRMSTETFKSIIRICGAVMSGKVFTKPTLQKYRPLYRSCISHLKFIDVMTAMLSTHDFKTIHTSVKFVTDMIDVALKYHYAGIITLAGRLKHLSFFNIVGSLAQIENVNLVEAINGLKKAYYSLNDSLHKTRFDLQVESHAIMLNNLFTYLDVSLNESGTPALPDEFVKTGFTANPRDFVVTNFSILLAMDLKILVKDSNKSFKKRFHEEMIMSNHKRTFPLYLFIEKCTDILLDIIYCPAKYPSVCSSVLCWDMMIYYSMYNALVMWQDSRSLTENDHDFSSIVQLLMLSMYLFEQSLSRKTMSIEDCLIYTSQHSLGTYRKLQVRRMQEIEAKNWNHRFKEFDESLSREVLNFVVEQRVAMLLKGVWVLALDHVQYIKENEDTGPPPAKIYGFFQLLSNCERLLYGEYDSKDSPPTPDTLNEVVPIANVTDITAVKSGSLKIDGPAKSKVVLTHIVIKGSQGKLLLQFYADSGFDKLVWIDGIKMLKGWLGPDNLSPETVLQMATLKQLRRSTQLLALEAEDINASDRESEDEKEYYDPKVLQDVVQGFCYI